MTVDDPESAATCCHHAAWCPPDPCTNSTAGPSESRWARNPSQSSTSTAKLPLVISALTWIQTNVTDLAGCYRRTPTSLHLGTWQPQLRLYPHSGEHRCDQGLNDAGRRGGRDMGAGAPPADGRSRARGHLRRIRDARRRYHLAGDRPPPGRSPSLRVGVQRFPAGKRDWHRAGRDAGRPCAARADDARRSCPVRPRPGCRRDRAGHAGSRGGPGGPGSWRRGRARSGLRGYLPVLSRGVPAAHVRRPFHRMGGARPDRAGRRRPGGRGSWLAVGVLGLAAAGDRGWGAGRAGLAACPAAR